MSLIETLYIFVLFLICGKLLSELIGIWWS
jgi:hypothetical protein